MIAALYIDERGPYVGRPDVDAWGISRDAKLYDGPHPVVAHPPCGPWGNLRHLCRYQDATCAPRAVEQVWKFGGILEHPAHSRIFAHCGLPIPGDPPDAFGGRTIEVCQVDWGHVARKRTWLYLVGVTEIGVMPPPREPTHWAAGGHHSKNGHSCIPAGMKACSAQQRRRTPPAFADWLIALAHSARRTEAA